MGEKIKIVEVGPRDGLQNEAQTLSIKDRIEFIRQLIDCGFNFIEAGSFVSPKKIPQLADSEEVWKAFQNEKVDLSFLLANERGLERAIQAGVKSIALVTATSNEFNKKNIGMSVEESLRVIESIATKATEKKIKMRGYISTAFGCPYEGPQSPEATVEIAKRFFDLGCLEVSVGDTIGVAHPKQVEEMVSLLSKNSNLKRIAMHFHDTRGMALVNIKTAFDLGVRIFDSSIGGLGGCPYAEGSSGNVATEELAWFFEGYGLDTGISIKKLLETSKWIETKIGRKLKSRLYLSQPKRLFYDGKK